MQWRISMLSFVIAGVLLALPSAVFAQDYPNRMVRIVSPFGAGSPPDLAARVLARSLEQQFGQSFIVENMPRPLLGIPAVRNWVGSAKPDGYEIGMWHDGQLTIGRAVLETMDPPQTLGFDPRTFGFLGTFGMVRFALIANKDFPPNTPAEMIAYIKARPGQVNVGVWSPSHRLIAALLKAQGLDVVVVPNLEGGEARTIQDTISGAIHLMPVSTTNAVVQVKAGKVKLIGVIGPERNPFFPESPLLSEQGLPELGKIALSWGSLFCPPGCPPAVLATLRAGIKKANADPQVVADLMKIGLTPRDVSPEQFELMLDDVDVLKHMIRKTGIKLLGP